MSSFNNPPVTNPATKTLKWAGNDGTWSYWCREEETEKLFSLGPFVPLKTVSSISGYNETSGKGIWSNEVESLSDEFLVVKIGSEIRYNGLYKDIKEAVKADGGKFTTVVYAMANTSTGNEVVKILMAGSALTGWIEKKFDPIAAQCGVLFAGVTDGMKGAVKFKIPFFKSLPLREETFKAAGELCSKVCRYFAAGKPENPQAIEEREAERYEAPDPMNCPARDLPEVEQPFNQAVDDGIPF